MTTLRAEGPVMPRSRRTVWWAIGAAAMALALGVTVAIATARPLSTPFVASAPAPGVEVNAYQPRIIASQALMVVHEQNLGAHSVISILDRQSGQLLGQINAADSPLVLMRKSHNQLLVSDVVNTSAGVWVPRLLTFDLSNGLRPQGNAMPMPDRTTYPIYTPSMALSADERFLYYMKRTDCGFQCNEVALGIIDLEARGSETVARLPINCGQVLLTPRGASDTAAMCPILGSLWAVSSSGTAQILAQGFETPGLYAAVSPTGAPYWITMSGELFVRDPQGGTLIRKSLLTPGSGALTGIYRWQEGGRVLLGVKAAATAEAIASVLSVDSNTWVVGAYAVPPGTTYLAPLSDGRLAAVHGSQIDMLSSLTGAQLGPSYSAPAGQSPWLVAP